MLHRPITFQTTQTTTTPAASAFDDFNPTSSNTSSSRAAFLSALIHHQPQHPVMNHYPSQTSSGLPSPNFPPSKLPPAAPGSRTVSTRFPKERPFTPLVEDVFYPGDLIGQGLRLQGETITSPTNAPPQHFEVVRKLGTGSYAVVYLVREVTLFDSRSVDDLPLGELELDGVENPRTISMPGREYAIKCLSKANLDDDALEAQMLEATIHESLPTHHNIVTLHQTLETSSFLLLVLESVPGEDLFYFLEQSRDHDSDDGHSSSSHHSHTTATPPTPSLLSSANPSQLLAHRRLRLIASMFAQMCDAVATCHDVGVYHRDIKPENFIVTDGFVPGVDGLPERRVIVKLSDFGLATTDSESTDMDCGSAPYMSYECRNHCAPTYSPRDADVWSLGIVLINMLYHHNPWSDTSDGTFHAQCPSFASYLSSPVQFFMNQSRFPGMTRSVAQYLATNVFCLLDPPPHLQRARARARRTSAREFGAWVRNLPSHMAQPEDRTRSFSISPERRAALAGESESPRSSRSRSLRPLSTDRDLLEQMSTDPLALTPELDPPRSSDSSVRSLPRLADDIYELPEVEASSRATSTRRRKRGARSANKGNRSRPGTSDGGTDAHLEGLAAASQDLARELSKTSKYASPMTPSMIREPLAIMTPIKPPTRISSPTSFTPAKKSKWRDMFRSKESIVDVPPIPQPNFEDLSLREKKRERSTSSRMSTKASNVTTMLLALDPPTAPQPVPEQEPSSSRGRTIEPRASPSIDVPSKPSSVQRSQGDRWPRPDRSPPRNRGPYDTPAGNGSTHSFGSPNASANKSTWRNSTATTSSYASSSAFTRFSNGSVRSVSTQATSVSALSWRSSAAQSKVSVAPSEKSNRSIPAAKEKPARGPLPPNVKRMDGIPWELHEVPRQMRVKPGKGDIFGAPPTKPRRAAGASTARLPLDTISEKPRSAPKPPSPLHVVTTPSTTDLPSAPPSGNASSTSQAVSPTPAGNTSDLGNGERPKKVQKAQINTLAKMLSAFGKAR